MINTTADQLAEALRAVFDGTIRRELLALIAERDELRSRLRKLENIAYQYIPETHQECIVCGTPKVTCRMMSLWDMDNCAFARRKNAVFVWYCDKHAPTAAEGGEE